MGNAIRLWDATVLNEEEHTIERSVVPITRAVLQGAVRPTNQSRCDSQMGFRAHRANQCRRGAASARRINGSR
jgi:hypothetical protein